jgi:hypothetical protein
VLSKDLGKSCRQYPDATRKTFRKRSESAYPQPRLAEAALHAALEDTHP